MGVVGKRDHVGGKKLGSDLRLDSDILASVA
jgi:hypothetical protein